MGARGPAPKPTKLRLLHGDRPARTNQDEPAAPTGPLVCPPGVSAEARAVWDYALANLIVMDVATPADRDALLCYCEAVVMHRRASAEMDTAPLMIEGITGAQIRNPVFSMQRDAATAIRAFAREFGFTPSARSDIHAGAARGNGNGAERFLTG